MPAQAYRLEREIEERNRPLSDEELDAMLPSEGYKVLDPPAGCVFNSSMLLPLRVQLPLVSALSLSPSHQHSKQHQLVRTVLWRGAHHMLCGMT